MQRRLFTLFAMATLLLAPIASWGDLAGEFRDFEALDAGYPGALADDGWLVFGNVFTPGGAYVRGYGPFPAPNGGAAFSAVVIGQGGPNQAAQQLSVYSDYNNGDHGAGLFVEANVYQDRVLTAADVGSSWTLSFDAKRGNIEGQTTAKAWFKTLDPNNGFALTNFVFTDMTNVGTSWEGREISIAITPNLVGQIFQYGFLSTATNYQGSGVFYDNVALTQVPLAVSLDVKPGSCPNPINKKSRGVLPAAVLGTADFDVLSIDVSTLRLEGVEPLMSALDDVATPYGNDLCGCTEDGPDGYQDLTLKFMTQEVVAAIGAATGDVQLILTGNLLDGTPIAGGDCVLAVNGSLRSMLEGTVGTGGSGDIRDLSMGGSGSSSGDDGSRDSRKLIRPNRRR